MTRIKSLKNFIAYKNIVKDYKKLDFYYKEFQEKKEFTEKEILNILFKEINILLNNIIENKLILDIDSSDDKALQLEINNFIVSINTNEAAKNGVNK